MIGIWLKILRTVGTGSAEKRVCEKWIYSLRMLSVYTFP